MNKAASDNDWPPPWGPPWPPRPSEKTEMNTQKLTEELDRLIANGPYGNSVSSKDRSTIINACIKVFSNMLQENPDTKPNQFEFAERVEAELATVIPAWLLVLLVKFALALVFEWLWEHRNLS